MGFTAATILTTDVPERLDPLKYLTTPPQTKAQEQAQAQAQALAYGKLHGMSISELERVIYGAETGKPQAFKQLSHEEQQELQDAKMPKIPTRIDPPAEVHYTQVDYPYLFTNTRVRATYQSLDVHKSRLPSRHSSHIGSVPAPVLSPSAEELAVGSRYIAEIQKELDKFGIVKLQLPIKWQYARIPFGIDQPAFKTRRQTVLNPGSTLDLNQLKRGFFRALIRFHLETPQKRRLSKLPVLERKPVDYFRLFLLVEQRGGAEAVVKRKEWAQVGRELGHSTNTSPTLSSVVRQLYMRILHPLKTWLDAQIPGKIDFKKLLRVDVDDEGTSEWHRLPFGIVIDLSDVRTNVANRQVREIEEPRLVPAFSNLRLLRQKNSEEEVQGRSIQELESDFANLPEFYESEHIFPKPRLYKQSKENMANFSGEAMKDHDFLDPWDFTTLSLRENTAFYPFIIDQDLDELVVPELDIGNQFATQSWYCPKAGTYQANMVVHGKPRTWYTKQGVWTDQSSSEIVIVAPDTEAMNWCHGVSTMISTNILLDENWLVKACAQDERPNNDVCVQQIVYEAAHSNVPLDAGVKRQVLHALTNLRERELHLLNRLSTVNVEKRIVTDQLPVICARSKRRRYFSWIVANGEPLSLEAFLDDYLPGTVDSSNGHGNGKAGGSPKLRLMCRYEDATSFFDELKARVEASTEAQSWKQDVNTAMAQQTKWLPTESTLMQLKQQAPSKYHHFAAQLSAATNKLHLFLNSDGSFEKFGELIECADDKNVLAKKYQQLAHGLSKAETLYHELTSALDNPEDEQGVSVHQAIEIANALSQQCSEYLSKEIVKGLQMFPALLEWVNDVIVTLRNLEEPSTNIRNELLQLQLRSQSLGGLGRCKPGELLAEAIQKTNKAENALSKLLNGDREFIASEEMILDYKAQYIDKRGGFDDVGDLDPTKLSQFRLMCDHIDLFRRMGDPSFLNRPKKSELASLMVIPVVSRIVSQLDMWLKEAKELDWNAIAFQIHLVATGAPIGEHRLSFVSVSNIARVYTNLFSLKCVPDDVHSVNQTFQNTVGRLTTTPTVLLQQYGFFP